MSVEYMSVMAVGLTIFLFVWLFVTNMASNASDTAAIASSRQAVTRLADAANLVYTQGPPAQVRVYVNLPGQVTNFNVSGRQIQLLLRTSAGVGDVHELTYGPLFGNNIDSVNSAPGTHYFTVTAVNGPAGTVNVQVNETTS